MRLAWRLWWLGAALVLSGCPPNLDVRLYNNSGHPITVLAPDGTTCSSPAGSECTFSFFETFNVRSSGREYRYAMPSRLRYETSPSYVERRWFRARVLRLQFASDNAIDMLPSKEAQSGAAAQLTGFPVRPDETSSVSKAKP